MALLIAMVADNSLGNVYEDPQNISIYLQLLNTKQGGNGQVFGVLRRVKMPMGIALVFLKFFDTAKGGIRILTQSFSAMAEL